MAHWDRAYCLAQCQLYAEQPSTDNQQTTAQWYLLLTEAQEHWYGQFAIHCPWVLMSAPTQLSSSDSGQTYDMPNDEDSNPIVPLHIQVYDKENGRILRPATYWDNSGDYVWEGTKIRFAGNRTKTFSDGPYIRYIAPPNAIDASQEPTLQPIRARKLMVLHAVVSWASRGGRRNPKPFEERMNLAWCGNKKGDVMKATGGLLVELKMANPFLGAEALTAYDVSPLQSIDTGEGYTAL